MDFTAIDTDIMLNRREITSFYYYVINAAVELLETCEKLI
jgi:hypothetical protein